MRRRRFDDTQRALVGAASTALLACSSLLSLDQFQKVDCVDDCGVSGAAAAAANAGSNGSGGQAHAGGGGATALAGTTSAGGATSGSSSGGSSGSIATGEGGAGGEGDVGHVPGTCRGGLAPPSSWQEHWFEHDESLVLRHLDDCVAVYADPDMDGTDTVWLEQFLNKAWAYSLANYGDLGPERLFFVLHKDKFLGAHSSEFFDPSHDFRNVIDGGSTSWTPGDYDMAAHVMSFVVEYTAAHEKHGSPASAVWRSSGFAEIFKYDLYVGLGMTDEAKAAFDKFSPIKHSYPVPESYWFSDFYYPLWRDHGKTQLLVKFFELVEQYWPAPNGDMPDMSFGEYIHFMSGAAGTDVKKQATYAFGWDTPWEQELAQAKLDYPDISY